MLACFNGNFVCKEPKLSICNPDSSVDDKFFFEIQQHLTDWTSSLLSLSSEV